MRTIGDMPYDVMHLIEVHLTIADFVRWRCVVRTSFRPRHVREFAGMRLAKTRPPPLYRCVACDRNYITQLQWVDGSQRDMVPWCFHHIDPSILEDFELFCE